MATQGFRPNNEPDYSLSFGAVLALATRGARLALGLGLGSLVCPLSVVLLLAGAADAFFLLLARGFRTAGAVSLSVFVAAVEAFAFARGFGAGALVSATDELVLSTAAFGFLGARGRRLGAAVSAAGADAVFFDDSAGV